MASALDDDRLAKIEQRRGVTRRELAVLSNDAPARFAPTAAAILLAEKDVPDLVAEVNRLRDDLAEMTRCRDAAVRLAEREDTEIEFHLEDRLRDGLVGMATWPGPVPDHAPGWLILAVARIVRPELARLTEQRDELRAERDRYRAAFESLHARLLRDLPGDASELPPPDEQFWANQLDALLTYADELYQQTEGSE